MTPTNDSFTELTNEQKLELALRLIGEVLNTSNANTQTSGGTNPDPGGRPDKP